MRQGFSVRVFLAGARFDQSPHALTNIGMTKPRNNNMYDKTAHVRPGRRAGNSLQSWMCMLEAADQQSVCLMQRRLSVVVL